MTGKSLASKGGNLRLQSEHEIDDMFDTDEIAAQLSRLGEVAIFNHGKGWSCRVDMFVSSDAKGVKFEVKSEINHKHMRAAMRQCLFRACKALESAGGAV